MPVDVGDVLRIVDRMTAYSQAIMNVYHCIITGTTGANDGQVLTAIRTWLDAVHEEYDTSVHEDLTFDYCEVIDVTQERSLGTQDMVDPVQGEAVDNMLPMQCAAVLRFPTGTLGSQGRKFLAGFSEVAQDDGGTLTPTALTRLAATAAVMLGGWAVGTIEGIPGNYDAVLDTFRPWLSALVNIDMGTQRRRKKGSGI